MVLQRPFELAGQTRSWLPKENEWLGIGRVRTRRVVARAGSSTIVGGGGDLKRVESWGLLVACWSVSQRVVMAGLFGHTR